MISAWLEDPYFDPVTRSQVRALYDDPTELENAFLADLKFGTGGLRGIMGVGTYRMNIYTIRRATQALANYLSAKGSVVIGYDNRHNSELFAKEAARVLAANNISVFLSSELRPTPFISFACRHLKASAAIMITASHNPKEYNGFKVFWSGGAQVVSPHDSGIMAEMDKITSYTDVLLAPLDSPLIQPIDKSVDTAYLQAVSSLFPSAPKSLSICYSSLHGTGITLLPAALSACGFSPPLLVSSQCTPDGDFLYAPSPNPESPSALTEGLALLDETKSDLLLVTDPDADRIGVAILHQGKPIILNGQQLAALGAYYLCQKARPHQTLMTTLVTTPLLDHIAAAFQVDVIRTLTGFKYIGEKIGEHEDSFLFGAEESHGYLLGTYCRDKDGISAACLFATLAAELKCQGKTCFDYLLEIYTRFGIFQEKTVSLTFSNGKEGLEQISRLMHSFRTCPPSSIADIPLTDTIDLLLPHPTYPSADVLQWTLKDQSRIIIRPSGTEPKLKVYLSASEQLQTSVEEAIDACAAKLEKLSEFFQVSV